MFVVQCSSSHRGQKVVVTLLSAVADQKRNEHSAIQITLLSIICTFKFFSVSTF